MPKNRSVRVDNLTRTQRSACMASVKSTNSRPEMVVRRLVHSLGCRYRLHHRELPGTPDIVLRRYRSVIFVHGCFWHMHCCKRGKSTPRTNAEFWRTKREKTRIRDRHNIADLRREGWRVLVVWECQTRDHVNLAERLSTFIKGGERSPGAGAGMKEVASRSPVRLARQRGTRAQGRRRCRAQSPLVDRECPVGPT